MKLLLLLLIAFSEITITAQEQCLDYLLSLSMTGYSSIKESTTGETSRAPDNSFWVSDKKSGLFAFNASGGAPRASLKLIGSASSSVTFMGTTPQSKGLIGTDMGWIYVVNQDGSISSKKRMSTDEVFSSEAIKVTPNEYVLISETGIAHSISNNGEFLDSTYSNTPSSLAITSKASVFADKSLIYSGYDQDDSGKPIFKTRILKPSGEVIEYKTPQIVNHAPGIGTLNGSNVAVMFGAKGLLRCVNENGTDASSRQLSCFHEGGFAKIANDQFAASCVDSKTGKPKLLIISTNGAVTESMTLPAVPSSEFSIVTNPITGRPNIVCGFTDDYVRSIDPVSGVITSEWKDEAKFGGSTLAKPTATANGFIVQKGQDIVNLSWQTGSSSKQAVKTSNKNCGRTQQSSDSAQDHAS